MQQLEREEERKNLNTEEVMIDPSRCHITGSLRPTNSIIMAFLRARVFGRVRLSTLLLFLLLSALFIFIVNMNSTKQSNSSDDILNPSYLQQQYRRKLAQKYNLKDDTPQIQMCKVPKLSIATDMNQFAFHAMDPLECMSDDLFYLKNYELKIKETVLGRKKLSKCKYKAIEWENDNDIKLSDPLERKSPGPFELKIKNEFFHVECYLEKDNETRDEMTSLEQQFRYDTRRRLLQIHEQDHQEKWRVASDQAIEKVIQDGSLKERSIKDIVQRVQNQNNAFEGSSQNTFKNKAGNNVQNQGHQQGVQNPFFIPKNQGKTIALNQNQQLAKGGLGQSNMYSQKKSGVGAYIETFQNSLRNVNQENPAFRNHGGVMAQNAGTNVYMHKTNLGNQPRYMGSVGLPDSPLIGQHAQQVYTGLKENRANLPNIAVQQNPSPHQNQGLNMKQPGYPSQSQKVSSQNQRVVPFPQQNQEFTQQTNYPQNQGINFLSKQSQGFIHQKQFMQQPNHHLQGQAADGSNVNQNVQNQNKPVLSKGLNPAPVQNQYIQNNPVQNFQPHQTQNPVQKQNLNVPGQPQGQRAGFGGQDSVKLAESPAQGQFQQPNQVQALSGEVNRIKDGVDTARLAGLKQEDRSIDLNHPPPDENAKVSTLMPTTKTQKTEEESDIQLIEDSAQYGGTVPPFNDYYGNYNIDMADYEQYFAQLVPKEDVMKRIREIPKKSTEQMNVLIFGMDSMSHLTYQRKLPKTYEYIQKKLHSVVLNGYNIVGDATTAAIIPITTGKTEAELPEVRKNKERSTYVDAYPLIWNKFEQRGYVTLFTEDKPDIAVFNLRLNGFEEIPTDHYMRPFYQAVLRSELKQRSENYCTGGKPSHLYMLDYLKQFFDRYPRDMNKFAFGFLCDLSHDDNNPSEYIDTDLVNFLEHLRFRNHLNNTVVILMGDHGARYSRVRKTTQGKLEERLPMMSFAFPKWFRRKYPSLMANLVTNADRLTTPFDIHATLLSILDLKSLEKPLKKGVRGRSLLQEHPLNRTCSDAGVDAHWCTCMNWQEINRKNSHVLMAAEKLLEHINARSDKHRNICSKLTLREVSDAKIGLPNEKVLKYLESSDSDQRVANFTNELKTDVFYLQLIIETFPGRGLYEGTVTLSDKGKTYKVDSNVSRINKYGQQAHCVTENFPDLRMFCYCKDPPPPSSRTRPRQTGHSGAQGRGHS